MEQSTDAKSRISESVAALLLEGVPAGEITVRQIAEKAGVGIGTINYHFQSKDRLIYEAVSKMLTGIAEKLGQGIMPDGQTPRERLENFLIQSSDMLLQNYETYKLQINYELSKGDLSTPLYIIPIVREITGSSKSEIEIRLMALQIISGMQVALLNPARFKDYSGVDIFNKEQRDEAINLLLNNITGKGV